MNGFVKGFIVAVVLIYFVLPMDVAPGLLDDIIVLIIGMVTNRQLTEKKENE